MDGNDGLTRLTDRPNGTEIIRLVATMVLVLVLLLATAVQAVDQGELVGQVVDPDGDPLRGVEIAVTGGGVVPFAAALETDGEGRFTLIVPTVEVLYHLTFGADGYRPLAAEVRLVADEATEQTFTLRPSSIDRLDDVVIAFERGDLITAETELRQVLEVRPDLIEAVALLAEVLAAAEDWEGARRAADRVIEEGPECPPRSSRLCLATRAYDVRYRAARAMGFEPAAESALEALAAGDAISAAVAFYNEGVEALAAGAHETAAERFIRATELDPGLAVAHAALGELAMRTTEPTTALAAADRALRIRPDDPVALAVRYEALLALGRFAAAEEAIEALALRDPEAAAERYFLRATEARRDDDDPVLAVDLLERALALDADHVATHYELGRLAVERGDAESARRHLERFLELAPDHPDAPAARALLADPDDYDPALPTNAGW